VTVVVQVVPNASRAGVVGLHGTRLRVRVSAPPEGGRANKAVGTVLTAFFGVRADLLSGAGSKIKRYLLRGLALEAAEARMRRLRR
jgi:uncharacterized protein (TIGR00251 family)